MAMELSHATIGFLLLCVCVSPSMVIATVNQAVDEALETPLEEYNQPTIKTIQSPDGDVVDCVPFNLQPTFNNQHVKGVKLPDPPEIPKELSLFNDSSSKVIQQTWMESGESCPQGSIPVLRSNKKEFFRRNSTESYRRKTMVRSGFVGGYIHEHAYGRLSGGEYYGAQATINIWQPFVSPLSAFSLAQLWLSTGSYDTELETIEVGWQVCYGDFKPRLFIYWTGDTYKNGTGCYNLNCTGFVQTNHQIAIGASLSPSAYGGQQNEFTILVWRDPEHGNWWLKVGGQVVGYWPATLFNNLSSFATTVDFGGEVAYKGADHTSTDMGSGHFAKEGFGRAAYFRNLEVVNSALALYSATPLQFNAERKGCYDILGGASPSWGQYFFYGGPGRSSICP